MHHYHITWSRNSKTGYIPVSTTSEDSCPETCTHKVNGTCYAKFSYLGLHWKKVSSGLRSISLHQLVSFVKSLPKGQLWRHNQAGDLPGIGGTIDDHALREIVDANQGKRGFTYTHKPLTTENISLIRFSISKGFTINVSTDSVMEAVTAYNASLPTVITMPDTTPNKFTQHGVRFVVCPSQIKDDITCLMCGICANADREFVIVFKAHGSRKGLINANIPNRLQTVS